MRIDLVYYGDGTIAAFRNGQLYGQPYRTKALQPFNGGQWQALFGLRHGTQAEAGRLLSGKILRVAVYDRPLWPKPEPAPLAYALISHAPGVTHVLERGNALQPREVISPGALGSLGKIDFGLSADAPEGARRQALAAWITRADNPLFARTIVNRVWHWHFGQGLVATPNDLGRNGGEPSHPELLDWLAGWFQDHGWSLKKLHQLLVTSAIYQQASTPRKDCAARDSGNRFLWRFTPRRLTAEELRDAMLVVAGALNPQRGGASYQDFRMENTANTMHYHPEERASAETNRRTIYRMWARGGASPMLGAFDCPDSSASAPARSTTITPLSALNLLNSEFTFAMSEQWSARLQQGAGPNLASKVERACWLAFARPPTVEEKERWSRFEETQGLPALCRVLFNASEFLFLK